MNRTRSADWAVKIARREYERDVMNWVSDAVVKGNMEKENRSQQSRRYNALLRMFYRLEMAISESEKNINQGCYPYIPFAHNIFHRKLKEVVTNLSKSKPWNDIFFLEVGCGIGTKLYIAAELVELNHVCGIEISEYYSSIARSFLGQDIVLTMNALHYKHYDKHDVIYSYSPMIGTEQTQLTDLIKNNMKQGAIYMSPTWEGKEGIGLFIKE